MYANSCRLLCLTLLLTHSNTGWKTPTLLLSKKHLQTQLFLPSQCQSRKKCNSKRRVDIAGGSFIEWTDKQHHALCACRNITDKKKGQRRALPHPQLVLVTSGISSAKCMKICVTSKALTLPKLHSQCQWRSYSNALRHPVNYQLHKLRITWTEIWLHFVLEPFYPE